MSKFSKYLKAREGKEVKFFFGEDTKLYGNHVDFKHYKDKDNIIIITNNVKYFFNKDCYVLVVDNDKIVYLKSWQLKPVKNWDLKVNTWAVKLNRNYFKPFKLSFVFEDYCFEKEDTFDDLVNVAKSQDENKTIFKLGHYKCLKGHYSTF